MPLPGKERLCFRTDPDRDSERTEYFEKNRLLTPAAKGKIHDEAKTSSSPLPKGSGPGGAPELSAHIKAQAGLLNDGTLIETTDAGGNKVIDVNPEAGQSGG